ncbi:hypothetical protein SLE2022_166260 [Rubroshorea leprosula]
MDLPEAYENWNSFKQNIQGQGIEPFCMSAVSREGTLEVVCAGYDLVQKCKESNKECEGHTFIWQYLFHFLISRICYLVMHPLMFNIDWSIYLALTAQDLNYVVEFEIIHDNSSNTWLVTGAGLQRLVQMRNWL